MLVTAADEALDDQTSFSAETAPDAMGNSDNLDRRQLRLLRLQYRPALGEFIPVEVRRNDEIDVEGIRSLDPDRVVVLSGPGKLEDARVSVDVFAETDYPALGVCLGYQALCAAHDVSVGHAPEVIRGKPSEMRHDGAGLYAGLSDSLEVGRYHSLPVERESLPSRLVDGLDGRRLRDPDGRPACGPTARWRPVSSRGYPHRRGQADHRELPLDGRPTFGLFRVISFGATLTVANESPIASQIFTVIPLLF